MKIKKTFRVKVASSLFVALAGIGIIMSGVQYGGADDANAATVAPWRPGNISTVSAGSRHTCAIASNVAYCWGNNEYGQLGDGSTAGTISPVAVVADNFAGDDITSISASSTHTCAVVSGQAYCWGRGTYGALGNGTTSDSTVPVAVSTTGVLAGKTVTAVAVGSDHTCAIADRQAYCWGYNGGYGALGNGSTNSSTVPVAVSITGVLAGKTVTSIMAGSSHTCVIADGQVYCWGYNGYGILGDGSTNSSTVPVAVSITGVLAGKTVTSITANVFTTCAIAAGQAYCWGYNGYGRLGSDSTTTSTVPVAVSTTGVLAGKTVTSITAGGDHTCAIADGQAYCWGGNSSGELGDGTTIDSTVPVAVTTTGGLAGKVVASIAASTQHACAATDDEYLYCWGANHTGQLGYDSSKYRVDAGTPVPVGDVIPDPKEINEVEFITKDSKQFLTVRGTGLVGEEIAYEYEDALGRSLVTLNGEPLPFCAFGGYTKEQIVELGVPADLVSDTALCYLLASDVGAALITTTEAVIWIPEDFDAAAPGTVSVNGSPTFSFNQLAETPPVVVNPPAPETPPTSVTPPVVANPPAQIKEGSQGATPSPVATKRVADLAPEKRVESNSDTTAAATVLIAGKNLSDGHMVISARPTFTGKAPAGSNVTVTVHSDPVTCSAVADNSDSWSCTLTEDLPAGSHTVRLAVVTPDNETMNYGPYAVVVDDESLNDVDTRTDPGTAESSNKSDSPKLNIPLVGGTIAALLAVGIVAVMLLKRR